MWKRCKMDNFVFNFYKEKEIHAPKSHNVIISTIPAQNACQNKRNKDLENDLIYVAWNCFAPNYPTNINSYPRVPWAGISGGLSSLHFHYETLVLVKSVFQFVQIWRYVQMFIRIWDIDFYFFLNSGKATNAQMSDLVVIRVRFPPSISQVVIKIVAFWINNELDPSPKANP